MRRVEGNHGRHAAKSRAANSEQLATEGFSRCYDRESWTGYGRKKNVPDSDEEEASGGVLQEGHQPHPNVTCGCPTH